MSMSLLWMFYVELRRPYRILNWTTLFEPCVKTVNHDQVQVLSYSQYSSLFLPIVGIEPVTSRWFHSEELSNQITYPLHYVSLLNNSEWIFGTYKPNVSINSWGTLLHYHIKCFYPSSYHNIFYQAFLINGSQIIFISILGLLNRSL